MSESPVFIHAGMLQGEAMIFRSGLSCLAWRSSGRICASSWAMLNVRRGKSVRPGATSS